MTAYDKPKLNESKTAPGSLQANMAGKKTGLHLQDNRPQSIVQKKQADALANRGATEAPVQKKDNNTGLPDQLKIGIENLSGHSMDDVKVQYNSEKPAQLNAHAYAQGTAIHLAAGQEKHLAHEAWHVVQQKQGRVKPTLQMKGKVNINDDRGLEKEADMMGARAVSAVSKGSAQDFKIVSGPGAAQIQRKLMVNNRPFIPPHTAVTAITLAANDEYVRHYKSEEEMKANLVSRAPASFGLIESRALWYNLPYLSKEFFVFGEFHSGVKGGDIKRASNITKPILNEALSGWNVSDAPTHGPVTTDQGLEENSTKLFRALLAWKPKTPGPPVLGEAEAAQPALPVIPEGEESTRETENGSYRLVVKGADGSSELWRPRGAELAPPNTYNMQDEAYEAIKGLFPIVFAKEIREGRLNTIVDKLADSWSHFGQMYNIDGVFFNKETKRPIEKWDLIVSNVKKLMIAAAEKKLLENYRQWHANAPNAGVFKAPGSKALASIDDYRNEYILSSVLKAKLSNAYAFATMGDGHLNALKGRLTAHGIPYISAADFYGQYSKVAVSLASDKLDREITDFFNAVKAARVVPTEARIQGFLEKLDTKGYPGDSPLRVELITLLDLANTYGFKDAAPPPTGPDENELMARKLGFI